MGPGLGSCVVCDRVSSAVSAERTIVGPTGPGNPSAAAFCYCECST